MICSRLDHDTKQTTTIRPSCDLCLIRLTQLEKEKTASSVIYSRLGHDTKQTTTIRPLCDLCLIRLTQLEKEKKPASSVIFSRLSHDTKQTMTIPPSCDLCHASSLRHDLDTKQNTTLCDMCLIKVKVSKSQQKVNYYDSPIM